MFFWQPPPPPPPPPPTAAPTIIITTALVVACTVLLLYSVRAKRGKLLAPGAPPGPLAPVGVLKNGFATRKIPADLDAVVVGSGIAGLTTAALLAKRGQRVLVLEQHDVAGGCTHTFEEKGYEFDTGLHYVGDLLGTLLNTVTTGQIEWAGTGEVVDEVLFAGERVAIRSPKSAFLSDLRERFPAERGAVAAYSRQAFWAHVRLGAALAPKALWPAFGRVLGALLGAVLGPMKTTDEGLRGLTANARLRQLLSYIWGTYGVPPSLSPYAFHLVLQNHYFNGGYYPVGGTAQLAARLVPTIEAAGGAVLVRANVTSLECDASGAVSGVVVRGETVVRARRVISAAGAFNTFTRLVPEIHRHRVAGPITAMRDAPPIGPPQPKGCEPSVAFLYLFVGVDETSDAPLELPKPNRWVFPSWDHETACALPERLNDVVADHPLVARPPPRQAGAPRARADALRVLGEVRGRPRQAPRRGVRGAQSGPPGAAAREAARARARAAGPRARLRRPRHAAEQQLLPRHQVGRGVRPQPHARALRAAVAHAVDAAAQPAPHRAGRRDRRRHRRRDQRLLHRRPRRPDGLGPQRGRAALRRRAGAGELTPSLTVCLTGRPLHVSGSLHVRDTVAGPPLDHVSRVV